MKTLLSSLLAFLIYFNANAGCFTYNISGTVTNATCVGLNNGSIKITDVGSVGGAFQTSTKPLLISEIFSNPNGNDSPFEFVELVATKDINFSVTPYTVIFSNNGTATTDGWIEGGQITYAFSITTGTVTAGQVVYVGGSSMVATGTQLRVLNTSLGGDGGIGTGNATGVLGNGGTNADGIAVFDLPVASITSSSVPIDAIFFGAAIGQALVSNGTAGFQLPINDLYNGGKLQANSLIALDPTTDQSIVAIGGVYDVQTNTFTTPRTWQISNSFSDVATNISVGGLYNYIWSNGATTQNIAALAPNNYSVTLTDAFSCTGTQSFVVTRNSTLQVVLEADSVLCYGQANGAITTSVSGGSTNPLRTYLWSNGATLQNISGLSVSNYCVTVTDFDGCTATACTNVFQPDSLKIETLNIDSTSCFGGSDGVIEIQVSGGIPSYVVNWSNGNSNTLQLNNLSAGTYSVTIEDVNFCTKTKTFNVLQPDSLNIESIVIDDIRCFGGNGSLQVFVSGGTIINGNYLFEWSNNTISNDGSLTSLSVGTYSGTVTDEKGCSKSFIAGTIGEPNPLTVNTSNIIFESCLGVSSDGIWEVQRTGGTFPFTLYTWSNGEQGFDNFIDSLPASGGYSVTVTDANGCTASTSSNFGFLSNLSVNIANVVDASSCALSDGAITLDISGESSNPTFTWSNAATTEDISGLNANTYSVTVTDGDCTVSVVDIEVECTVGIENQIIASQLVAAINYNQLYIKANEMVSKVEVYSLNGSLMFSSKNNNTLFTETIATDNWSKGLYLVKFSLNNQSNILKKVMNY